MKITVKELKEMIRESVEDAVVKYPEYRTYGRAEKSPRQEELDAEIKHLLRVVIPAESRKAARGEPHESIVGLFAQVHQKREERNLLNREEDD